MSSKSKDGEKKLIWPNYKTAASGFFCFFLKSLKQETMGLKTAKTSGVGRLARGFAFAFQGLVHEGTALIKSFYARS